MCVFEWETDQELHVNEASKLRYVLSWKHDKFIISYIKNKLLCSLLALVFYSLIPNNRYLSFTGSDRPLVHPPSEMSLQIFLGLAAFSKQKADLSVGLLFFYGDQFLLTGRKHWRGRSIFTFNNLILWNFGYVWHEHSYQTYNAIYMEENGKSFIGLVEYVQI